MRPLRSSVILKETKVSEEKKDKTVLEKLKDFFKFHFNPENTFDKKLSKELKKTKEKEK
jgi:hypothetical protein